MAEVNWEIIDSGKLWERKIEERKIEERKASESIEAIWRQQNGIKWVTLVKRSTMTIMQVKSLDFGISIIKSIDMSDQDLLGVDKGESSQ